MSLLCDSQENIAHIVAEITIYMLFGYRGLTSLRILRSKGEHLIQKSLKYPSPSFDITKFISFANEITRYLQMA